MGKLIKHTLPHRPNPRELPSLAGKVAGLAHEWGIRCANPSALRTNSPLCHPLGLTTSVRLSPTVYAWCTAFAAVTLDLPHCRVQFRIPRWLSEASRRSCAASGSKPSFSLTQSAASFYP